MRHAQELDRAKTKEIHAIRKVSVINYKIKYHNFNGKLVANILYIFVPFTTLVL